MIEKQVLSQTSETPSIDLVEQLGKAEGNLKFLAQAEMATFTQGEAVLDALHAVQQAFELFRQIQKENEFAI
tara:strand:+ start:125 stop:340 length:216 start_codon:yes stop_codon:yes gene_type:complete